MQPKLRFCSQKLIHPSSIARHFLGWLPMLVLATGSLFSQTTWDGSAGTDWNNAANWSAGIPDAADNVTIPNVANDPTLSTAGAVAQSVTVQSGGVLTITSAGTLTIDGATVQGILNQGTVNNSGTITIGTAVSGGVYGLNNHGIFNNNPGGQINIDRSTESGIRNVSGTFTNLAAITMGATASVGKVGIINEGSATFNNTSGQITINNATSSGISNVGNFTNQTMITIGATASVGSTGLENLGNFDNNAGGQIRIDNVTVFGLFNDAGTFTNQAAITIGATASVGNFGLRNDVTFNNTGGQINIDRAAIAGLFNLSGTFTNQATITIGAQVATTNLVTANSGTISNSTGGIFKGRGSIAAANFINAGGTLAPGYSPGKMTFNASEDFSNSILAIEVNGAGVAGTDFDQVAVTGTATLGASSLLNLVFGYAAGNGTTFDILTASTAVSGSFTFPANVSFSNTGAGNVTAVSLSYPGGNMVRVTVTTPLVLPVELVRFTAKEVDNAVLLEWTTASEQHNAGFHIERSSDGLRWTDIGFVAGKGTTTEAQNYSFLDEKPLTGRDYYQLRQINFDGKEEMSKVVIIELKNAGTVRVFPNPVSNGELTVFLSENTEEEIAVQLFSPMGQVVRSMIISSGTNLLYIKDLPTGVYTLQMVRGHERAVEKIVVQH